MTNGREHDHHHWRAALSVPLFSSADRFDSGSGWPGCLRPAAAGHLRTAVDTRHGGQRVEVRCEACGARRGHVFADGPAPGGLRYRINPAALNPDQGAE